MIQTIDHLRLDDREIFAQRPFTDNHGLKHLDCNSSKTFVHAEAQLNNWANQTWHILNLIATHLHKPIALTFICTGFPSNSLPSTSQQFSTVLSNIPSNLPDSATFLFREGLQSKSVTANKS